MSRILVKMSDFKCTTSPNTLKTNSLGSCVGVILYDKQNKIGGMAHVMLAIAPNDNEEIGKYANTAIPQIISDLKDLGANIEKLEAMLFGGAEMFFSTNSVSIMQIGKKNVDMCKNILSELSIPIISEETGGRVGRTIEFDCDSGALKLSDFEQNIKLYNFNKKERYGS